MQRPPNGWSQPPQPYPPQAHPSQAPPGYGPPQPQAYGAPPVPHASSAVPYGAPPQPPGYGAAPPGYGAPPAPGYGHPSQPPQAYPPVGGFGAQQFAQPPYGGPTPGMIPGQPQAPVAPVGLFGRFPCPHCGSPTTSHANGGAAAQWAGGLVGWLIVTAVSTKHYCVNHGEVPKSAFPLQHQSAMTNRMVMKLALGVGIFVLCFGIYFVAALVS